MVLRKGQIIEFRLTEMIKGQQQKNDQTDLWHPPPQQAKGQHLQQIGNQKTQPIGPNLLLTQIVPVDEMIGRAMGNAGRQHDKPEKNPFVQRRNFPEETK